MRLVKLSVANVNPTVGAVRANVEAMASLAEEAATAGAVLVAFGEQAVGGYGAEELVHRPEFVAAQWTGLGKLAALTSALPLALVTGVVVAWQAGVFNAVAWVQGGRVHGVVPKERLPNHGIFHEARLFCAGVPGLSGTLPGGVPFGDLLFDTPWGCVGLEVCEDLWSPLGPMLRRTTAGAELVVNVSASPFRIGISAQRQALVLTRSRDYQATLLYTNLIGGQDALVFDGGGWVAQNGTLVHEAPRFREGVSCVTVDLDRTQRLRRAQPSWASERPPACLQRVRVAGPPPSATWTYPALPPAFVLPPQEGEGTHVASAEGRRLFCEELLTVLTLGVRDYFTKAGVFDTVAVALSGGRDSLLCLIVARRMLEGLFQGHPPAARAEEVRRCLRAVFLPSRYTSEATRMAAEAAAEEFGATFTVVSIDDACVREQAAIEAMLQPGEALSPLALQNLQARVRALRMATFANSCRALWLQTSNMSEKAVGYTTLGGDLEGAFSVLANVPKTVVNYLLAYLADTTEGGSIARTLAIPASAELAPGQEDETELMPFAVLDACLALYVGEQLSPPDLLQALQSLFPARDPDALRGWSERFVALFAASIHKGVQAPLSVHVGELDLDHERALHLPVIQKAWWP